MNYPIPNLDAILHNVAKPARYTGGEWNEIKKDWDKIPLKIALAYPDLYDIGMSNMGIPILYNLINAIPDALAERVFTPWMDMIAEMRRTNIPLYSLETKHPIKEFDVLGFSLGYELTFSNVLTMLNLAGIPVFAGERGDNDPIVIAGGTATLNSEPMSDFIDFFVLGDGEEVILELVSALGEWKKRKGNRKQLLEKVAGISGVYVPSFYEAKYLYDGLFESLKPFNSAGPSIHRRVVNNLGSPVTRPIVPYVETVHDRGQLEIQRGCSRGCRFCQASVIYRPVRERQPKEVIESVGEIISNCGYNEISLVSLSSSDYPEIQTVVNDLLQRYHKERISLQLPSLRIDNFSLELMDALSEGRRTGLTFAPEAGTERLRKVINKPISTDEILGTASAAFERGWTGIKLYFMIGLPTETMEDIQGIVDLVGAIRAVGSKSSSRQPQIRISISTFVPKPHTPFQWVTQDDETKLATKQALLERALNRKGVRLSWSDPKSSLLEAALTRGDRRLGQAIFNAWKNGAVYDAWSDLFKYDHWAKAFSETGLDPAFYAQRERSVDELLPWGHIDTGVSGEFLKREYKLAIGGQITPDCRFTPCHNCGLEQSSIICQEKRKKAMV